MRQIPHSRPWLTADDLSAISAALDSCMIGQGARVEELEQRLAGWVGAAGGVATASGTAAVCLALRALGCAPGREVILPSYICRSVLEAVLATGATPVLCDNGPAWVMEPANVAPHLTPRTQAIIVPHVFGIFAEVAKFRQFRVPVVEDFAQAVGHPQAPVLAGDIGIFSFHPTKCLTTGEGGMCVASDPVLLGRLQSARRSDHAAGGSRAFSPMSDLTAALGLSQLERYPFALARRKEIAARYDRALAGGVARCAPGNPTTMHFRYPLRVEGGITRYAQLFSDQGVVVRRGVDELMHRVLGLPDGEFRQATEAFAETVSLPLYPSMPEADLETCLAAARDILGANPAQTGI